MGCAGFLTPSTAGRLRISVVFAAEVCGDCEVISERAHPVCVPSGWLSPLPLAFSTEAGPCFCRDERGVPLPPGGDGVFQRTDRVMGGEAHPNVP